MTLDELKRHPYYPFRNFQTDDLAFLLLELYWTALFRRILEEKKKGEQWVGPWVPRSPADREDGNPIFSVIDRSVSVPRALRIVQRFNTQGLAELDLGTLSPIRFTGDAYVAFVPGLTYGATDDDGSTPMEELLISSDVSEPCERLNHRLIEKWCVERVSVEEMQKMVDAYWESVREKLIEIP